MRFEVHRIRLSFEFAMSLRSSDTSLYCPETVRRPALGPSLENPERGLLSWNQLRGAHRNLNRRTHSTV